MVGAEGSTDATLQGGACSEEEAAMESEENNSEGSASEDSPPAAAASATQREYAELVAGLMHNPAARFAASSFDLLRALREEHQQLSRQQEQLGAQRLKAQWLPLIQQLQQLQQQEQLQSGPQQLQQQERLQSEPQQRQLQQQQQQLDHALLLRCLHALQDDGALWERQANVEACGRSSSSSDSDLTTTGLLHQLEQGQLFHQSGRLFTAVDADAEVWTSSDEDYDEEQQQHQSGSSRGHSSRSHGSTSGTPWGVDEKLRFPAPVLPLRAALRGVRKQQRDELQVKQLLLQWSQPQSRLRQLQQVASAWAEDGLFSAARAATQQGQQQPLQQQRKKPHEPREDHGAAAFESGDDAAHALAELRRVEQLEVAKDRRRELRAWKAAARELFGFDMYGGLEQLLQSAALVAAKTSTRKEAAVAAARALLPDDEQQQLLHLLRRCGVTAEEQQEPAKGGGGKRQEQQQREEKKKMPIVAGGEETTKKRQDKAELREEPHLQMSQIRISPPPACFFSHGLEELRCVCCRAWLTQTQQLLQLQQEGSCSFLLQPVQTRLVKQLLLLQHEQRLQHTLGGRRVATAGAAAASAGQIRGGVEAAGLRDLAAGTGKAAAARADSQGDEESSEETDAGYEIVAAPDVGISPNAEKLYVGHLGMLYTTVWGGGYSCGPHASELLLWLRLLQPFYPLQLRRDGAPRSGERHAQRWQLLRDAYYRSGVVQQQKQKQQQPYYLLPFEDWHQQQQPKKAKSASVSLYKSLYTRALQKKDKTVVESDADSSETEVEALERRLIAAARRRQQEQQTAAHRKQRSEDVASAAVSSLSRPASASEEATFFDAAADVEMEVAEEAEGAAQTAAATKGGPQGEASRARVTGREARPRADEQESAFEEDTLGVSRYLKYLGKGFVHANRAWMHKPLRRRRMPLPLPGWRAGGSATAAVAKGYTDRSNASSHEGLRASASSSRRAQDEAATSRKGGEGLQLHQQHLLREKAAAEAERRQQQPLTNAENEEFSWTLELSSSEDSVSAYRGGAALYRRRYRVWRRRQRELQARRLQQQQQWQELHDRPTSHRSSLRRGTSAAEDETVSGAAALVAAGDPGAVDRSRQGHALEDFLKRLGGMSYSRYSQLAATAAAGAAAAAAAARRQLLGGRLKRRRGESRSSINKSAGPSVEQRAAALQLQQLRPRKVWGWHWAVDTRDDEDEEEDGRGFGFMHMLNFRKKLYCMRRKPRTRTVEPSWDLQLQQRTRRKHGPIQALQQGKPHWQLQQSWHQQQRQQHRETQQQPSVDEEAAQTEESPGVFPFGMAATGWWGPSAGDPGAAPGSHVAPKGKGREVQFVCVDERELHTRMGKTKLYQTRCDGLEDELANRREYYAVIDEESRRVHVVPAGRLSFFLTESPRQTERDFMEQLFGDLRRNARGSLLQTLLLKRRSARNVLLMNAMLWQSQLKHLNQIRLCRLLGGFWRDAAFASGDAPLTEQQLLEDFLSVNAHALHALEAALAKDASAGGVASSSAAAAAQQQEACTRWRRAAAALEDRWRHERTARDPETGEETDEHLQKIGVNLAEAPLVDAAAARMRVPRAALCLIDRAVTDAAFVAALAAAAADRRSQREACRHLLPRLLLRYIHQIFPAFVHVYLTSRCAFAVQKADEQNFTRRLRQVENVGLKSCESLNKSLSRDDLEIISQKKPFTKLTLAGAGNAGSFTGEVLRGQLERTFGESAALRPTTRTMEEHSDLSSLERVLPPFNNRATTPAELFKLDDLVPLSILQDVQMEGFSGDPFLPLIEGGRSAEAVDVAALEGQWGRFAVDLARHIGRERQNLHATRADLATVDKLVKTMSVEALARLVKVMKALAALFRRQRKSFSGERGVTRFFEDIINSCACDNSSATGKGNTAASQTLPRSAIRWVTKTFLQQDGRGHYFLSPEKQTKLLATLAWLCTALSQKWTFDFEVLLNHEWRGRFNLNFEACAALVGLRRARSKARPREYCLELPPALVQGGIHATSRPTAVLSLLTREKGRRTAR